ncbi:MAG: hypothetical protein IJQ45_01265 [Clostridia bacterium]|nr:hypothetical protein [Clostridia bacterium]
MKRTFAILIALLLLAACQPTPRSEAVVNKGDDTLETVIHSEPQMSAEAAQTVGDALGVPETVQRTVSGTVYGGTLHVEMDAAVHMPQVSRVPVLRVGRLHPSAEDKRRIAETLTGRTVFFEADPLGRDRWLNVADQYREALAALEKRPYGPEADYESLQAEYNDALRRVLTYYNEFQPGQPQPWTGTWSDALVSVYTESGQHIWIETETKETCSIQYDASDATPRGSRAAITADAARRLVEDALALLGNTHYEIVAVQPADQGLRDRFHSDTGVDDGSYKITLRPMYEGIPVYEWNTYYGSDSAAQQAGLSFAQPPIKESLGAEVRGSQLVTLSWLDPLEVLGTENENVSLLPFERIIEIFEKQVFMNVYLSGGERTVKVTDVFFSYRCVKIQDSDQYYLLPVWDFVGYDTLIAGKGPVKWKDSILSVNAVDGSILNDLLGY